jgi:replicative DNA helicase
MSTNLRKSKYQKKEETPESQQLKNMNYDISFQRGLLKVALSDEIFARTLIKYSKTDVDTSKVPVIDDKYLNWILKQIGDSLQLYDAIPSEGHIKQCAMQMPQVEQNDFLGAIDLVLKMEINDQDYYKRHFTGWMAATKIANGLHNVLKGWQNDAESAIATLSDYIDQGRSILQTKIPDFNLSDFEKFYTDSLTNNNESIPTGIPDLDNDLLGGLPKAALSIVLSSTNAGKSVFSLNLGVQALKRGKKVIHINLEGRKDQLMYRYVSCLCGITYRRLRKRELSSSELAQVSKVLAQYKDKFVPYHLNDGYESRIEDIISYLKLKTASFGNPDMIIVDYGQLLDTDKTFNEERFKFKHIFQKLDRIAKIYNCVVVSPVQATRGAQEMLSAFVKTKNNSLPVIQSHHISEAMDIARIAEIIISLNATKEEMKDKKLRVFLEKQREEVKWKQYGLITDFSKMSLIGTEFYDPEAIGDEMSVTGDSGKTEKDGSNLRPGSTIPVPESMKGGSEFNIGKDFSASMANAPLREQMNESNRKNLEVDTLINEHKKLTIRMKQVSVAVKEGTATEDDEKELNSLIEGRKTITSKIKSLVQSSHPGKQLNEIYELVNDQIKDANSKGSGGAMVREAALTAERLKYALGDHKI